MTKKHIYETRVYYADTDAYGVVWHGTYLRWMEAGRIEFTDKILGLDLKKMQEEGCVLPVVDLNIKYKSSAKTDDKLILETEIAELNRSSIVFKQVLTNKETGNVHITATVTCVAVDTTTNKMMRRLPECIANAEI